MRAHKLYINNDDELSQDTYVGTLAEWTTCTDPAMRAWYDDYRARCIDCYPEDGIAPVSYAVWQARTLRSALSVATQADIDRYPAVTVTLQKGGEHT